MAWTAPRTWVAGEIVTAALLNTHLRDNLNDLSDGSWGRDVTFVRKSANEGVTNSATLQNDDQLLFTATASATYLVEVGLEVSVSGSSSASDFKLAWSLPSGNWTGGSPGPDVAMAAGSSVGSGEWVGLQGAVSASISYGLFNTGNTFWVHKMSFVNGVTGGTVNFQWAQNTATAGVTTTVLSGSYLRAERIA